MSKKYIAVLTDNGSMANLRNLLLWCIPVFGRFTSFHFLAIEWKKKRKTIIYSLYLSRVITQNSLYNLPTIIRIDFLLSRRTRCILVGALVVRSKWTNKNGQTKKQLNNDAQKHSQHVYITTSHNLIVKLPQFNLIFFFGDSILLYTWKWKCITRSMEKDKSFTHNIEMGGEATKHTHVYLPINDAIIIIIDVIFHFYHVALHKMMAQCGQNGGNAFVFFVFHLFGGTDNLSTEIC